jgi:hypothetical protein
MTNYQFFIWKARKHHLKQIRGGGGGVLLEVM